MDLSVVIISRSKEDKLEEVFESIAWVPEIVLLIDSSTEIDCDSAKIAAKYEARIFFRKLDNYSNQKNFAISQAKNNWILSLDSDEVVGSGLKEEIERVLSRSEYSGYFLPRKNLIGEKWLKNGGLFPDYTLRLFQKNKGKFFGEVHEKVNLEGRVGYLTSPLKHYTYRDLSDYRQKVRFYSEKEAMMDFDKGLRISLLDYAKIPLKFIKIFIFKLGFLDGYYGLMSAWLLAYYSWLKLDKMKNLGKK
jgi:glycosyltransferase involved in cell wall biosynthesis